MSEAATERIKKVRARKKLPTEELISVQLDELFEELGNISFSDWRRLLAMLLKWLANYLRAEAARLVAKVRAA